MIPNMANKEALQLSYRVHKNLRSLLNGGLFPGDISAAISECKTYVEGMIRETEEKLNQGNTASKEVDHAGRGQEAGQTQRDGSGKTSRAMRGLNPENRE